MTKGDLIVACLKLMFENDSTQLDATLISDNDEYKHRTANIVESINRGLEVVANYLKLPIKRAKLWSLKKCEEIYNTELTENEVGTEDKIVFTDKTTGDIEAIVTNQKTTSYKLPSDYLQTYKIVYTNKYERVTSIFGVREEDYITLDSAENGFYELYYHPKFVETITYDTPDTYEFKTIPTNILMMLPYFVKGELYEEDEPNIAVMTTNKFFSYLENIKVEPEVMQGAISKHILADYN